MPFDAEPTGWEQTTLGAVLASFAGGGTPPREVSSYWGGEIPWASVKDMTNAAAMPQETITPEGVANSTARMVPAGTNIVAMRMAVGVAARFKTDVAINQDLAALTPDDRLDADYLFQWLVANKEGFQSLATGTTVKGIRKDLLLQWPFLLPPRDEQRRIAEVLRSVDDALLCEERVIGRSVNVKSAAVEDFLIEARMHRTVPIHQITASMDSGWSPDCESVPASSGEWSVLKTSAVTWSGYHDGQNKRLPPGLSPRPSLSVELGDILITRAGPAERTGVVAIVEETSGRRMLSDKLIRLQVDRNLAVPRTIATILSSSFVQSQIGRVKSGMAASQTNISQSTVAMLEVPLPPLEAQERFAAFIAAVSEQTKASVTQRRSLLKLKALIAHDLLSGRVRVPA